MGNIPRFIGSHGKVNFFGEYMKYIVVIVGGILFSANVALAQSCELFEHSCPTQAELEDMKITELKSELKKQVGIYKSYKKIGKIYNKDGKTVAGVTFFAAAKFNVKPCAQKVKQVYIERLAN